MDAEKRIEELSNRNLMLYDGFNIKKNPRWKNLVFLDGRNIPLEVIAYHVGPPNQKVLVPRELGGNPDLNMGEVFFSTTLEDFEYYFDESGEEMVYFADLRRVSSGRVQKNYKHHVMFQDELLAEISKYREGKSGQSQIQEKINDWIEKYTTNFNPLRIERYKKQRSYVLIDAPIGVVLNQPAHS